MALGASPLTKPRIRVYGMYGSFKVGVVDNDDHIRVHYFSTVASGEHTTSAGDSLGLLRELKPMRERVQVSDLRDLSSLLQRELDDQRVAHDLVPYLKGESSKVGFFPGILVALIPRGFLKADQDVNYPAPEPEEQTTPGEVPVRYGPYWSAYRFTDAGGDILSLGRLEIDPDQTDVIVLDGQHRANAFRYVTGAFAAAEADNSIYRAFYEGVARPENFTSELPVTIVWFEATAPIDPKLISRKLFVDVNMNAKEVSASRRVLLDDRNRFAILVGSIYRLLAARAFDVECLSLLHMGFDCEEKEQHPLTLALPERVKYAMSYAGFAPGKYDAADASVSQEVAGKNRSYERLAMLAPDLDDADFRAAEGGDREALIRVNAQLDDQFAPKFLRILEEFPLAQAHVAASKALHGWVSQQTTSVIDAWDKVFRGGEGLYAGFMRAPNEGNAGTYKMAIKEISAKFVELRSEVLTGCEPDVARRSYDTFGSVAGVTALWMSAHTYCSMSPDGWDAYPKFIQDVQKISGPRWANLFVYYKQGIVKELTSRYWPDIRLIILRAVQSVAPENLFFDTQTIEHHNPDARYLRNQIARLVDAYLTSLIVQPTGTNYPSSEVREAWQAEAVRSLQHALAASAIEPMHNEKTLLEYCSQVIDSRLAAAQITAEAFDEADDDDDNGLGLDEELGSEG